MADAPADFEDVGAAMQDLQARLDKVEELAPMPCAPDLQAAFRSLSDAHETWNDLQEVAQGDE